MIRRKGFLAFLMLSVFLLLAAYITLIPYEEAEKVSLLGYRAISSLAPVTTVIFLASALAAQVVRRRFFTG